MRIILLHSALIFLASWSFSQTGTVKVSPKKAKVGQPIVLEYTMVMPGNSSFFHAPFGTIVPSRKKSDGGTLTTELSSDLELLSEFKDTVILNGKEKKWIGRYELTGWNEGNYVVSESKIIVNDSTIEFPTVELSLQLVSPEKGKDIYDIRENFTKIPAPPSKLLVFAKKNYLWIILISIALIFLLFRYFRKKQEASNEPIIELSLKERSLLAIDALERERLWEKGKLKEHYIELSFILRSYLSSRYELNLLENTTHETQLLLARKGLHNETIQVIGSVLDQSDMVKFARSAPKEMEVLKVSHMVRQVIAETSPLEFEHAE